MTIDPIGFRPLPSGEPEKKGTTAQTASDFEALLIGQMLKSAHSDAAGWLGTGEDSSSASLIEMAEEQIAKVVAQGGGLGLANMIERSLAGQSSQQQQEQTGPDQADSSTTQTSGKLR